MDTVSINELFVGKEKKKKKRTVECELLFRRHRYRTTLPVCVSKPVHVFVASTSSFVLLTPQCQHLLLLYAWQFFLRRSRLERSLNRPTQPNCTSASMTMMATPRLRTLRQYGHRFLQQQRQQHHQQTVSLLSRRRRQHLQWYHDLNGNNNKTSWKHRISRRTFASSVHNGSIVVADSVANDALWLIPRKGTGKSFYAQQQHARQTAKSRACSLSLANSHSLPDVCVSLSL